MAFQYMRICNTGLRNWNARFMVEVNIDWIESGVRHGAARAAVGSVPLLYRFAACAHVYTKARVGGLGPRPHSSGSLFRRKMEQPPWPPRSVQRGGLRTFADIAGTSTWKRHWPNAEWKYQCRANAAISYNQPFHYSVLATGPVVGKNVSTGRNFQVAIVP